MATRRTFLGAAVAATAAVMALGADAVAQSRTVEFTVLARTDRPMERQPGTRIVIRNLQGREVDRKTTGPDGEVVFRLPPGDYIVEARKNGLSGSTPSRVGPGPRDRQTVILR